LSVQAVVSSPRWLYLSHWVSVPVMLPALLPCTSEDEVKRGFMPYEVNQGTLPPELVIMQRGGNADHFDIIPANEAFPPQEAFQMLLDEVEVFGGGDAGGGE
jgi:hypothetical protein